MWRRAWAWMLALNSPIGTLIPGWTAVRADAAAEDTERLLLGSTGPVRVELSAAQRARRRELA